MLEVRSRSDIEGTIRAGVLEQGTVDLLRDVGVGERLAREGFVHHGIELRFAARGHRIDLPALTGGKAITVYAQHEVIKDLVAARLAASGTLVFEAKDVSIHDIEGERAARALRGRRRAAGARVRLRRRLRRLPRRVARYAARGRAHRVPALVPVRLVRHPHRGAAVLARADLRAARPRLCARQHALADAPAHVFPVRPHDRVEAWTDERIWAELRLRLETLDGWKPKEGRVIQKGIIAMRSFVCEPMQHGRLFLAGDAAHIVPPTGAKGLNLAVADVRVLAQALVERLRAGQRGPGCAPIRPPRCDGSGRRSGSRGG